MTEPEPSREFFKLRDLLGLLATLVVVETIVSGVLAWQGVWAGGLGIVPTTAVAAFCGGMAFGRRTQS